MAKNKYLDDIQVRNVHPDLKNELMAIANFKGISLSALLRPKLKEITDMYPDDIKKTIKK